MLRVGLGRRTLVNRIIAPSPSFLLNFADLGAGQVSTLEAASATTATFTRATTAWTKLPSGLWAQVNSGVPRSFYTGFDTNVGIYAGYLAEGARTNSCLQSRMLTSTVWIKTTATALSNETGIDGVANAASNIAASAGNGKCLQTVVLTAGQYTFSAWMHRNSGTGTISLTMDGGVTKTDIQTQLSSVYTLVQMTQTVTTATVGILIGTSGDVVAVDMCQLEAGAFASTPIPTTSATVTRNPDVLTYPTTVFSTSVGAVLSQAKTNGWSTAGSNMMLVCFTSGPIAPLYVAATLPTTQMRINDSTNFATATGISDFSVGQEKFISAWDSTGISIAGSGSSIATNSFDGSIGAANVGIGCNPSATGVEWFGSIYKVAYYGQKPSQSLMQQLSI